MGPRPSKSPPPTEPSGQRPVRTQHAHTRKWETLSERRRVPTKVQSQPFGAHHGHRRSHETFSEGRSHEMSAGPAPQRWSLVFNKACVVRFLFASYTICKMGSGAKPPYFLIPVPKVFPHVTSTSRKHHVLGMPLGRCIEAETPFPHRILSRRDVAAGVEPPRPFGILSPDARSRFNLLALKNFKSLRPQNRLR